MEIFISDLHLSDTRPGVSQLFFEFLAGPAKRASKLYILGDLFEFWAGDDDMEPPLHRHVADALKSLQVSGVGVSFLGGNRDFLIGPAYAAAAGAKLLPDISTHKIAGTPTLLLHGDTLCIDDLEYQQYRSQVHEPAFIADFLSRPLAERKAFINKLRVTSEEHKGNKDAVIMDVNDGAVREALVDAGVTRMIHGHTHRLATHRYDIDGRPCERWVLGDWGASGNYLRCETDGWRFFAWDGNASTTIKN